MKFCQDCDNMLYTQVFSEENNNKLVHYCLNCNQRYDNVELKDNCLFEIDFNIDNIKKESCINKYTTEDPTLPVAKGIKCPNKKCPVVPPETSKIVYINYDTEKMKYTYICLNCKEAGYTHIW